MIVRDETPGDYAAVDEVHDAAFGRPHEGRLVRALRREIARTGEPSVSLVAIDDSSAGTPVVGHVFFSPVTVAGRAGRLPPLGLAPLGVNPSHQRRGFGTLLAEKGIEACRALDVPFVVVLGDPAYYSRFGFERASAAGITLAFPVPDGAFMALELAPRALAGASGVVRYMAAFDGV